MPPEFTPSITPDQPVPDADLTRQAEAGADPVALTRQRLLDAAGPVFAEHGFRAATIRDICAKAGANIAAVHYHFGDKAGLYRAVLEYAHCAAREAFPAHELLNAAIPAEDRLRFYVHGFIRQILDQGRPAWHGQLMAREMVEPSEALDHIVETGIRPKWDVLVAICSELLAPHRDPDLIEHAATSVIGQCLLFKQSSAVIERLFDRKGYSSAELDNIARRISMFSLHALRGLRAERSDSVSGGSV